MSTPCHGSSHTGIKASAGLIYLLSKWRVDAVALGALLPVACKYSWMPWCRPCGGLQHSPVLPLAAQRGASVPLTEHPLLHAGHEASVVLSAVWGSEWVTCYRESSRMWEGTDSSTDLDSYQVIVWRDGFFLFFHSETIFLNLSFGGRADIFLPQRNIYC